MSGDELMIIIDHISGRGLSSNINEATLILVFSKLDLICSMHPAKNKKRKKKKKTEEKEREWKLSNFE